MPNEIPIPDDLNLLIEKRENEDRRGVERRSGDQSIEVSEERRSGMDQRIKTRRQDDH